MFCPAGHDQNPSLGLKNKTVKATKAIENSEPSSSEESDVRDKSDASGDDIVQISKRNWMLSTQSREQITRALKMAESASSLLLSMSTLASTSSANNAVKENKATLMALKEKTRRTDIEDRKDKSGGSWGLKPRNDKMRKVTYYI